MVKTEKKPAAQMVTALLTGAGTALVLCTVILLLCAGGILLGWFPLRAGRQLGLFVCILSAFFGGLTAIRRARIRVVPVGLVTGALFGLLMFFMAALLVDDAALGGGAIPVLLACLTAGGAAGLTGKKRKKRRL